MNIKLLQVAGKLWQEEEEKTFEESIAAVKKYEPKDEIQVELIKVMFSKTYY